MHIAPRHLTPALLAVGALALTACSGGGIDQSSENGVADGFVHAIASAQYDKACAVAVTSNGATPAAEDEKEMQDCIARSMAAHDYWATHDLLDAAKKAKGDPAGPDDYYDSERSVVFTGLSEDDGARKVKVYVDQIDGKYYASTYGLPW